MSVVHDIVLNQKQDEQKKGGKTCLVQALQVFCGVAATKLT